MTKTSELDKLIDGIPATDEDKAIEILETRKVRKMLEDERKRLNSYNKCLTPGCKGKLIGFDLDKYLIKGRKSYRLECDTCHRLHRLKIYYPDEPGLTPGEIDLYSLEFAWRKNHPSKMTDEQLSIWLDDESGRIKLNKSEYIRRDEQLIVRGLDMVNKMVVKLVRENKLLKKQLNDLKKNITKD